VPADVPTPGPGEVLVKVIPTYLPQDVADSIDLLRSGTVRPADFVTSVVPLDAVAEAFRQAAGPEHIKVLVTMDPAGTGPRSKG
jgi:hypothetical protein